MKIAFLENSLSIRGSTIALFDYAHYNETLLSHKSFVITRRFDPTRQDSSKDVYEKFEKRFPVFYYENEADIQHIVDAEKPEVLYILKYGTRADRLEKFQNTKVLNHCIFDPTDPHGDAFCVISPWLNLAFRTNFPVLPHIVSLPLLEDDLRIALSIPQDATVFGRHGGWNEFDHPVAQNTVARIAHECPHIYFVFMNTRPFMEPPPHRNVIFLEKSTDPVYKTKFINTCDAMLYARSRGETFGLAIAEFSIRNKPVFAPLHAPEQMHRLILKENAYWYTSETDLYWKVMTFKRELAKSQDWNMYKEYSPENVMQIFQKLLLQLSSVDEKCAT